MTDAEFLRALEDCSLPENEFGHRGHVRAAYLYLREGAFDQALSRIRRSLQAFATHHGKPERYHETMTVAYLALIHQHMFEDAEAGGWDAFALRHPNLLRRELLAGFYEPGVLNTATARSVFVLPRLPAMDVPTTELR